MRMERCANGHFYDAEKYASCPYCSGGNEGATVGLDNGSSDVTGGFYMPPAGGGEDVTVGGPTPTSTVGQGIGGFGGNPVPGVTVPGRYPEQPESDEGVTIGILKKIPEGQSAKEQSAKSTAAGNPVVGWLVCTSGINYGKCFNLYAGKNFIGRSERLDIYLQGDDAISRDIHAIVTYEPRQRQFYAQPGDSHSLFYVNDEVVLNNIKLSDRDEVTLGNTTLVFVPFCNEKFGWGV